MSRSAILDGIKAYKDGARHTVKSFDFEVERQNRPPRFIEIVEDYKIGLPVETIAAKFKCSRGTVNRYARLAELPKRIKGFGTPTETATLDLYKANIPIKEIAVALKVSEAYISKIASRNGISRYKGKLNV